MIRLIAFAPDPTDATSLYRAFGPLLAIKNHMVSVDAAPFNAPINWTTLRGYDGVFIQRPHTMLHLQLAKMAYDNRKSLWVDFDDDLFNVPRWNRASGLYDRQETMNNMVAIMMMAKFVTVSTQALKLRLRAIIREVIGSRRASGEALEPSWIGGPDKVRVLPNAYDEGLMTPIAKLKHEQHQVITWRGSGTHDKDLHEVTSDLRKFVDRFPQWVVNFVGEPFWLTVEKVTEAAKDKQRIVTTPPMDVHQYLSFLSMSRPAIMIVPLHDCAFNRAKSNIAWLEATHAGAVCLAPDWDEWKKPGVINYSSVEDFYDKLHNLATKQYDTAALYQKSVEFIRSTLTLAKVNDLRSALVLELVAPSDDE